MFPQHERPHVIAVGVFITSDGELELVGEFEQMTDLVLERGKMHQHIFGLRNAVGRNEEIGILGKIAEEDAHLLNDTRGIVELLTRLLQLMLLLVDEFQLGAIALIKIDGDAVDIGGTTHTVALHSLAAKAIPLVFARTLSIGFQFGSHIDADVHLEHLVALVKGRSVTHEDLLDIVGMNTLEHGVELDVLLLVVEPWGIQRRYPEAYLVLRDIPFPNVCFTIVEERLEFVEQFGHQFTRKRSMPSFR